jgi:hypothetical protein
MDFNYENLPKYIEIAEEVIRGLGGAAVNTVQFLDVMAKEYGISAPGALLAADTADSIEVNYFENTVKLVPELSPEEEPTEE